MRRTFRPQVTFAVGSKPYSGCGRGPERRRQTGPGFGQLHQRHRQRSSRQRHWQFHRPDLHHRSKPFTVDRDCQLIEHRYERHGHRDAYGPRCLRQPPHDRRPGHLVFSRQFRHQRWKHRSCRGQPQRHLHGDLHRHLRRHRAQHCCDARRKPRYFNPTDDYGESLTQVPVYQPHRRLLSRGYGSHDRDHDGHLEFCGHRRESRGVLGARHRHGHRYGRDCDSHQRFDLYSDDQRHWRIWDARTKPARQRDNS